MARTKKRKKKNPPKRQQLNLPNLVKKVARNYPFGECFICYDWKESGLAAIFISRKMPSGKFLVASYLVDVFCLGLKNSFLFPVLEEEDYGDRVFESGERMGLDFVSCDPVLAQNIIYGAIEYAEDLGFSPQKDFSQTQYLLDDVEAIEYMDIEFGKDGKPFYVQGPNDNPVMVYRQLEKVLGKDNFHIMGEF